MITVTVALALVLLATGTFAQSTVSVSDGISLPKATTMAPDSLTTQVFSLSNDVDLPNIDQVGTSVALTIPLGGDVVAEGYLTTSLSDYSGDLMGGVKVLLIPATEKTHFVAVAPFAYTLRGGLNPSYGVAATYAKPGDKVSVTGTTWVTGGNLEGGGGLDVALTENITAFGEYTSTDGLGIGALLIYDDLSGMIGTLEGDLYLNVGYSIGL